ncbi:hypothetical protein LTR94_034376 [Friedmanniomyces endolithicus]|nr:hypothetical protein LTR94_034376 [Friedmanniomyces endolithicus]
MNRRMAMGGDTSLNVSMREDGEGQWQDWLADDAPLQDSVVAEAQEADVYGVSRERVRQIEVRAFEKLQKAMMRIAGEKRLLAAA